ncbi:MAG TPA: hypothetical protein PKG60_06155 [Spirochaetota bacterium]|nr:hypothetical protein [Spirochaetota bacterium]HPS85685.1 hypothetical protein [Spirochaetota bacterium]
MNIKRFAAGGFAIFIIFQICDFIIHNLILGEIYMSMMNVWRPDMMSLMWIMYLTTFIMSYLMMFVFVKGYEGRGILEGVRFGIILGLMISVSGAFYQYAVYPLPFSLIIQWAIYGLIEFILAGIAAAAIYRPLACYGEETL